jgi:hypothetical protein
MKLFKADSAHRMRGQPGRLSCLQRQIHELQMGVELHWNVCELQSGDPRRDRLRLAKQSHLGSFCWFVVILMIAYPIRL